MARYISQRLGQGVFVVVGVLIVVFVILHLTGDPIALLVPPGTSGRDLDTLRHFYGLDQPLPVQLLHFLFGRLFTPAGMASTLNISTTAQIPVQIRPGWGAITGDFGNSFRFLNQPAMPIVLSRLPVTIQLMLAAAAYSTVLSLVLGTLSALRPYSRLDQSVRAFAILNQSVPNFWMGLLLILVFAVYLGILPATGYQGWQSVTLPAITLGSESLGRNTRLVRSSVLEVLSQDYIRTAKAKGLTERLVVTQHVLRNALLPVATVWGLDVATLFGGAVVTESIFGWPGMGRLIIESVTSRDYPTVEAAVFFIALVFVGINLIVDLSYVWWDPRIRLT